MTKGSRTSIVAAAALLATAASASAMPVAPVDTGSARIVLTSGGCGPYRHRTPFGTCRHDGPYGYGYGYGHRFHHHGWARHWGF